jgi:hypothetical protein
MNTGPKTTPILYNDVYGWFERVGRGLYALRPIGNEGLTEYPELVTQIRKDLDNLEQIDSK